MIASASLRFCPRVGRRPRDIVAGHGSLLTLRWREVDSNSQSPITKVAASGERQRGQALLNVPVCRWDREFESPLLQRGVSCEPDFRGVSLDAGTISSIGICIGILEI